MVGTRFIFKGSSALYAVHQMPLHPAPPYTYSALLHTARATLLQPTQLCAATQSAPRSRPGLQLYGSVNVPYVYLLLPTDPPLPTLLTTLHHSTYASHVALPAQVCFYLPVLVPNPVPVPGPVRNIYIYTYTYKHTCIYSAYASEVTLPQVMLFKWCAYLYSLSPVPVSNPVPNPLG